MDEAPEPVSLRKVEPGSDEWAGDVGDFRQGSSLSQWALARYLVGRAVAESMGVGLLVLGVLVLGGAALLWWGGITVAAVLVAIVGLLVLLVRAALTALLRRLTGLGRNSPGQPRLQALVADTRGDVLRELRRVRLPGRTVTLPLLALRLLSPRRRPEALARLRGFEVSRVVPAARLDELHLLLSSDSPLSNDNGNGSGERL